jgi:hypothetical protein
MSDLALQAWLDQEDQRVATAIRSSGCSIEYVMGGGCECCDDDPDPESPSFAYTIGLFGLGHPELLIFGTAPETAGAVLGDVFARVKAGADLLPGQLLTFEDWPHRIFVEEVPNPGDILFGANRHYRRPDEYSVPALQLTWDDTTGCFPWDDGYSAPLWIQPRPGTFRA